MKEVLAAASAVSETPGVMEHNSNIFTEELPNVVSSSEKLPRVGKWVVVVTRSFHTLGFLDPKGVWRDVQRACPIDDVESWHLLCDPIDTDGGAKRPTTMSNEIAV
jgi:hypothetical protein